MPHEAFPEDILEAFGKKVPDYQLTKLLADWDNRTKAEPHLHSTYGPHEPMAPTFKKPMDRLPKRSKKWDADAIDNQRDLLERAVKLLEEKTMLIQILEAQVDDMRRENDILKARIDGLTTRMEEHDDRINWLET